MKALFILLYVLSLQQLFYVSATGCSSQKDCRTNECCLTNNPPKGKRLLDFDIQGGHCISMGVSGDRCYAHRGISGLPPSSITNWCPCDINFTCHGSGVHEVPLGEIGACSRI